LKEYKNEDHISIAVIESATIAAIKSGRSDALIAQFILPSHLLSIAKELYDDKKYNPCIDFCKSAFQIKERMSVDALVETLRLWGLSSARLDQKNGVEFSVTELSRIGRKNANLQCHFVAGFDHRLRGRWTEAEDELRAAYALGQENMSVNRELASIYCHQYRFADAERHARAAFDFSPDNAFIVDILLTSLNGKKSQKIQTDEREIERLMNMLKTHSGTQGTSFYFARQAESLLYQNRYKEALDSVDGALKRSPNLPNLHFLRAMILIETGDVEGAEEEVGKIDQMLTTAGGFSREDEARLQEIQIKVLIERRRFAAARDRAKRSNVLPRANEKRLLAEIVRAIGFDPKGVEKDMLDWSKQYR